MPAATTRLPRRGWTAASTLVAALAAVIAVLAAPAPAFAAASLTIAPLAWNVIGLDSNNVNVGPDTFASGARVCNTGDAAATNVAAAWSWDSADPYIDLRPGSASSYSGATGVASLAVHDCHDFYFEVTIARNALAYGHTRAYHVTASADALAPVTTPMPRDLVVARLISQDRNHIDDVQLNGTSVASGGTMTLVVGQTYTITLFGSTATNGYDQLESFIDFPDTVFQILSVHTVYAADTSPVPNPSDKLYGDACTWDNDPASPTYLSCLGVGKVGGNVTVTYQVKILQLPGPPLTNPQPLESLFYDFSGASHHYNSDFATSARFAAIVDPTTLSLAKVFNPTPTTVNGVSTLTFTVGNPNAAAVGGLAFTDTFPTSPGAIVVANPPNATANGCGTPTFAPAAGAAAISFSGGTVAASGTCTVKVNVTAPVAGTYANTSSDLFAGTIDTGKSASASLTVVAGPPPPAPVCGVPLAQWNFPSGFDVSSPAPYAPGTTVTAQAEPGAGINSFASTQDHTVTPAGTVAWGSNGGFDSTGALNTSFNDDFELAVDTTGTSSVDMSFWARRPNGNAPTQVLVYYGTSATPPGTLQATLGSPPGTLFPSAQNSWESSGTITFGSGLNASGLTYFRIYGAFAKGSNPGADLYIDDVTFTGCAAPRPPGIAKAFAPSPVAVGGSSALSFTVTNPNPTVALSGLAFSDMLPAGLTVTSGTSTQCGGTLTLTAPSTIAWSGGALAGGASCIVTATVTATTAGPHDNVSGFVSATETGANNGSSGIATASLTAVLPLAIAKQFAPNPVLAGGVSTLTFTISNPNEDQPLSGVAFTDALPASPGAMVVAPAPNATATGCGTPTFAPAAGAAAIAFSGGTLAPAGTCTVTVDVTAPVAGAYANTSGPVSFVLNAQTIPGNSAGDTLTVTPSQPVITLLKQVGPTASGPWSYFLATGTGGNVFYRFTVENDGNVPLSAVTVDDPQVSTASCSWPNPLPVASPTADPTAACVVGPVAAASGVTPNTATASGTFGGTTVTSTSTARSATTGLTLVKSVTETSFSMAGDVLHYSYQVTNSGFAPLAGPVTVADDKAATVACPAVTTVGNLDDFLNPGESLTCTAAYTVTAGDVTAGFVTNHASATAGGATSNTATKTVTKPGAVVPPSIAKAFSPNPIAQGGVSTLTFTITNPNAGTALTGVAFTDSLPPGTAVAATPSASTSGCGAPAFAPTAAATTLSFASGTIAANGVCTVSVAVTAATAGPKVNTTGSVASTNGGTGNTATATLDVNATAPQVSATKISAFSGPTLRPGDTLTYTVHVMNTGTADASSVVFHDTPGVNTKLVAGSVTTTRGTVVQGNTTGDTAVTVDLGTLTSPSGAAVVTFAVTVDNPFPGDVTSVSNQGLVSGGNFTTVPTDDPRTPPIGDPTTDPVTVGTPAPPAIPTLSQWGAMLLGLLLALSAMARLGARRSRLREDRGSS